MHLISRGARLLTPLTRVLLFLGQFLGSLNDV